MIYFFSVSSDVIQNIVFYDEVCRTKSCSFVGGFDEKQGNYQDFFLKRQDIFY